MRHCASPKARMPRMSCSRTPRGVGLRDCRRAVQFANELQRLIVAVQKERVVAPHSLDARRDADATRQMRRHIRRKPVIAPLARAIKHQAGAPVLRQANPRAPPGDDACQAVDPRVAPHATPWRASQTDVGRAAPAKVAQHRAGRAGTTYLYSHRRNRVPAEVGYLPGNLRRIVLPDRHGIAKAGPEVRPRHRSAAT